MSSKIFYLNLGPSPATYREGEIFYGYQNLLDLKFSKSKPSSALRDTLVSFFLLFQQVLKQMYRQEIRGNRVTLLYPQTFI